MEIPHTLISVFNTAVFLGKRNKLSNLFSRYSTSLHLSCKLQHLFVASRFQGIDNRKSKLSLGHIISGRFTYLLGVVIIKDVITNLEDNTQILTESLRLFYLYGRSMS